MKERKKERKKKKLQLEPRHGWLLAGKLKGNLNVIWWFKFQISSNTKTETDELKQHILLLNAEQ